MDHVFEIAVAVLNSVVDSIKPTPSRTGGEGPVRGEEVQITITFTKPIVLPAGHGRNRRSRRRHHRPTDSAGSWTT